MTSTKAIAGSVADVSYDRLPEAIREATKRRLLDAVAVGLRCRDSESVRAVHRGLIPGSLHREQTPGRPEPTEEQTRPWGSTTIGSVTRAAMIDATAVVAGNGTTFLSPTPMPAGGSIAAVLASADAYGQTGEETLAGLAAAIELHGELAWHAPLDGLHPATHTAVTAAAGAGRAIGLEETELAAALGAASCRVTLDIGDGEDKPGERDAFSPIATGQAASAAVEACLLADGGMSMPDGITASNGWYDLVGPFDIDFDPGCERVLDAAVLPYESHPYGQPAIEAAIDLADETALDPADIETVTVETGEQAAPAIDSERIAAALVDRSLSIHRGGRTDLQPIADATAVTVDDGLGEADAESIPTRLLVETYGGAQYEKANDQFDGHPAAPASWGLIEEKFHALAGDSYDRERRESIVETVRRFEAESPAELARLLE